MIQMLRQILEDAIANGANEEQLGRIRNAIASAERAEAARNNNSTANQQQLKQMLREQAAMGETFAQGYVDQRERMMNAERETLRNLELAAAAGIEGMEDMAAAQRATMIQLEQGAVAADSLGDSFDGLMNNMGMNKDLADSVVGRFLIAGPEGFAAIGARIADTLDVQKLFSSGLVQMEKATKQLFTKFDESQATLSQQTATTGEYNDMLYDTIESNKSYNVTVDDAANAIKDLHNEMTIFNQMSSEQQTMLVETTARMEQLGVSTQAGAQQFDNMIQGMGMTANMANDASMELVALGDSIGMAASQLSEGFNAAASELAKYGPDAIDVFKGMAAAAKSTGIEMNTLMSITKQFDTFEGAAQSAGKLNAILGGGVVNSMDLLNATEEERVRLLIQSMALSGKNYESLNRFEKQAIASAAGIQDMTEANKLFSMSLSSYDDMQSKARGASAEAAKLQERAQAATDFADKLKQIGQAFAVAFMPVLEFAHGFANIILEINDMTGGLFIPLMLTVVGVLAMLSRVQQIAAIATSVQTGAQFIQTASTSGLAAAQTQLAATQTATTVTTTAAIPATTGLATAMTTLLVPVLPLVPAIIALGIGFAGLGLAIAAPLIALSTMVIAMRDVFIAMLEAPSAIAPALLGLIGFAAAGALAMQILAIGMVSAALIMFPFFPIFGIVAPFLLVFASAVTVAAGSFYTLGAGLERLGEALMVWKKIKSKTMLSVVESLAMFTAAMIPLIVPLTVIGLLVGIPLMLIGSGLNTFADGLAKWKKLGPKYMTNVVESLGMFTAALIPLVVPLTVIGLLVGIPLMMIGAGLQSFAKGLKLFRKIGGDEMENVVNALALFTLTMIPLIVPLFVIGLLIGIPLMLIGNGLMAFAKGLKKFRRIGSEIMDNVIGALYRFTMWMIPLSVPFAVIGLLVGIPLMLIGHGLMAFAKGLRRFSSIGEEIMDNVIDALFRFTFWMMWIAVPLAFVGLLVSVPLAMLGYALTVFGKALQEFIKVGAREAMIVVASLGALMWLFDDGRAQRFAFGAAIISIPLAMISGALIIYGKALQAFTNIDPINAAAAIALLPLLAFAVALSADLLLAYGLQFTIGLGLVSLGLAAFGTALQAFNDVGVGTIFIAISALMAFAGAMAFLISTGLLYFMIEGFTLLSVPLGLFSIGLMGVGIGLAMIREELPAMYALSSALKIIAEIGAYGAYAMDAIAISILKIAEAMSLIPEGKTISFGFAMQGYASALAQVAALTPESVESAEKVVAAAGEYAEIQATMRMPNEDAFIQAMKNVFGIGEAKDKKQGQDVVLELNGRELGRAVDAIINKRHNLSID